MSATCPRCGAFSPTDVCVRCGHRRGSARRTAVIASLVVAAIGLVALATVGIAGPMLDDAETTASGAASSAAAVSTPADAEAESLRRLGLLLGDPDLLDLLAIREAASAVSDVTPSAATRAYAAALIGYVDEPGDGTGVAALAAEAALERSGDPSVLAAFDPAILLGTGNRFDTASPPRRSGWVAADGSAMACHLAVQEATCIWRDGSLRVFGADGTADDAGWDASTWPSEVSVVSGPVMTPDGLIVCDLPNAGEASPCRSVGSYYAGP